MAGKGFQSIEVTGPGHRNHRCLLPRKEAGTAIPVVENHMPGVEIHLEPHERTPPQGAQTPIREADDQTTIRDCDAGPQRRGPNAVTPSEPRWHNPMSLLSRLKNQPQTYNVNPCTSA